MIRRIIFFLKAWLGPRAQNTPHTNPPAHTSITHTNKCTHARMYACTHARTHARTHAHTDTQTRTVAHALTHIHTYTHTVIQWVMRWRDPESYSTRRPRVTASSNLTIPGPRGEESRIISGPSGWVDRGRHRAKWWKDQQCLRTAWPENGRDVCGPRGKWWKDPLPSKVQWTVEGMVLLVAPGASGEESCKAQGWMIHDSPGPSARQTMTLQDPM